MDELSLRSAYIALRPAKVEGAARRHDTLAERELAMRMRSRTVGRQRRTAEAVGSKR